MIDNYKQVMEQWSNPHVGSCTNMMTIEPDEEMRRWCVQKTVTILANSDYYYTKEEVDHLLEMVTASGVTKLRPIPKEYSTLTPNQRSMRF